MKRIISENIIFGYSEVSELIRSYILGVEAQVEDSINRYYNSQKEQISDNLEFDDMPTLTHLGLDSGPWNLEEIFVEHFPNLLRRSALVTLFSFFESQLNEFCNVMKFNDSLQLSYKDISGQGIERSKKYLEKVIYLNLSELLPVWNEIKIIQTIRNLIVHQDGEMDSLSEGLSKEINRYIRSKSPLLSDERGIVIQSGYLLHAASVFEKYFKGLESMVEHTSIVENDNWDAFFR
ncbi:hypothetical protein [Leptospira sarikeiensis]|uniref:RiboL-PSP-HEPN domain-containing protein n=1 Tax=Leptospira sarikeiensis TaxID=2484943 RepID=A0A4V3JR60_9LEPT|nr:hypothetical protein [Leptospira sarikeiensis]TGL58735.1 hypothetical protein EHQ64_16925 [Leptospira sarikeiensis]